MKEKAIEREREKEIKELTKPRRDTDLITERPTTGLYSNYAHIFPSSCSIPRL